jgi:uncharacterized protein
VNGPPFRANIINFIRRNANPPDKFSHQERLYDLAVDLAEGKPFDDDVVFAAAWMHDLGVFVGHRPEDPQALAKWDHLAYVLLKAPVILTDAGFPREKIPAVLEAIRTHMPASDPESFEGILVRDADILEQLGAVGILRTVSKVGRDTRFVRFSDALRVLQRSLKDLPGKLRLESARRLAQPRIEALQCFLNSAAEETGTIPW